MTDMREKLALQIRSALSEFNDQELPVVECVKNLAQAARTGGETGTHDYKISACYFPGTGEIEISYEKQSEGFESCYLTLPVTPEQGASLASVIDPCVYYSASTPPPAAKVPEGWTIDSEELAQFFHEKYEELAPDFSYKTRESSAVPWPSVPEDNKNLMRAVCEKVIEKFTAAPQPVEGE